MRDPSLFTGLPVLLVSEALTDIQELLPPDIRVVLVRFCNDSTAIFDGSDEVPPSDVMLAIVSDSAEDHVLRTALSRHGAPAPPICYSTAGEGILPIVIHALVGIMTAVVHREATTRQALLVLREEAEETREALRAMRQSIASSIPSQALVPVLALQPSGEDASVVFARTFHLAVHIPVDVHMLTAVSLHVVGCRLQLHDWFRIRIVGEESGRVMAAWDLPAAAMPHGAGWITLDLPLPIESARETVRFEIEGDFESDSWIELSQSPGSGPDCCEESAMLALRLFVATGPRLVRSPWWNWNALSSKDSSLDRVAGEAIPGRCWLGATLLGAARLMPTGDGIWRIRLGAGGSAVLLFPDVPIKTAAAVLAQVKCESGAGPEVACALALIPAAPHPPTDLTSAVEAAVHWTPVRKLRSSSTPISLPLIGGGADAAGILLVLRHMGEHKADFAMISCTGIVLLPKTDNYGISPRDLFVGRAAQSPPNIAFEDVHLDESFVGETYRHLDLSIQNLNDDNSLWGHVKFKLFEDKGNCGLEFRAAPGWPALFRSWPGEDEDAFGQIYKLYGAEQLSDAMQTLPERLDRALLEALATVLPHIIQTLATRELIQPTTADSWLMIARSLRRENLHPVR